MPVYFLDSSALIKRYRFEAGSERLRTLLDAADRLFIARLAEVEVCAALVRRGRASGNPTRELDTALGAFDQDLSRSFEIVELDLLVVKHAITLVRKHFLRAADGIQLACALLAHGDTPQEDFSVLSSDQELNAAASAEGLSVDDPSA